MYVSGVINVSPDGADTCYLTNYIPAVFRCPGARRVENELIKDKIDRKYQIKDRLIARIHKNSKNDVSIPI